MGLESCGPRPDKLEAYIGEIEYWNPLYKLVARGEDLAVRHVLDSLAGLETVQSFSPRRIADVGSGAGFPGIPLSLWLDESDFFLIERSQRRAGFLRNAVLTLGLDNVAVIEKPVEQAAGDGPFDMAVFRAWAAVDKRSLKKIVPLLGPKGVVIAYKGKIAAAKAEMGGMNSLFHTEIRPINVPELEEERCLGIISYPDGVNGLEDS